MAIKNHFSDCEEFRAWNRLEPRTRKADFDRVLRTEIADPLWMLTRQWQFGEFKGDDGGSPVFTKVKLDHTVVGRMKMGDAPAVPYNDQEPLEQWVESEPAPLDFRSRALAGQQWMAFLKQKFAAGGIFTNMRAYQNDAAQRFGLHLSAAELTDDLPIEIAKIRLALNAKLTQFVAALHGRGMDGVHLYAAFQAQLDDTVNALTLDPAHLAAVNEAAVAFQVWYQQKFNLATAENSAWDATRLEYRFAVALPENEAPNTVLAASEYYSGQLDWYHFEVQKSLEGVSPDLTAPFSTEEKAGALSGRVFTVIPSAARYAGMPNKRWWEFEESAVDLGNINAETTDIAKILLVEYALMYGNDWFVIPFELPAGSLSVIPGMVVTDVFGVRTLVRPAMQGQSDDWSSWGMFNLSPVQTSLNNAVRQPVDTRLFLPPATTRTQDGQPLEKVIFVRDEMANMVWAIEDTLPDHTGGSMDGLAAANALTTRLHQLDQTDTPPPPPAENAQLTWQLGNTVPENWIPFIPVHIPGQNRAIRLQRASMPRLFRSVFTSVRPTGDILRVGMDDSGQEIAPFVQENAQVQLKPYFVNEEEVPRAGCRIVAHHQRTRWYGGKNLQWYGRYKTSGRGEGSSGLTFDTVRYAKKE